MRIIFFPYLTNVVHDRISMYNTHLITEKPNPCQKKLSWKKQEVMYQITGSISPWKEGQ